jgi:hypothetical protein
MERVPLCELVEDVDIGCIKDVVEFEFVVLDPTGELFLAPNCVNAATDRIAIATAATINANRFRARFVTGF